MITIPTSELTGTIGDVLGFVDDDKNNAYRGVVIAWDPDAYELRVSAYDVLSGGRALWTPGDGVEGLVDESGDAPTETADWGGDDYAWRIFIGLDDAKEIVKTFRLPAKESLVPVTVETNIAGNRLIVAREKTAKRSAHTMTIEGSLDALRITPDPVEVAGRTLAGTLNRGEGQAQRSLRVAGYRLAAFAAVRRFDTAAFVFGAEGEPTAVTIGSRFTGFIYPAGQAYAVKAEAIARSARTEVAEPAADI